jgi:hypothetical protein
MSLWLPTESTMASTKSRGIAIVGFRKSRVDLSPLVSSLRSLAQWPVPRQNGERVRTEGELRIQPVL